MQAETGQYDYGARFYDPVIGKFNTIDRFAEKYSSMTPYQYAGDDPTLMVDLHGDSHWRKFVGRGKRVNATCAPPVR